ncbi:MAG: AAA family ATPase [Patescibacteria group bacterium]
MEKILVIVLSGAPSSGKTTAFRQLAADAELGSKILFVEESAAELIPIHEMRDDDAFDKLPMEAQQSFQRLVAAHSVHKSFLARRRAERLGKRIVIFDRHTLDGAGYLKGGVSELLSVTGMTVTDLIAGVDHVLFLAAPPEAHYVINTYRFEPYAFALKRGEGVYRAWSDHHPDVTVIDGDTWPAKYANLVAEIRRLMNL